jgi:hypothetical protein
VDAGGACSVSYTIFYLDSNAVTLYSLPRELLASFTLTQVESTFRHPQPGVCAISWWKNTPVFLPSEQ